MRPRQFVKGSLKLLAVDVDGTLLSKGQPISQRNLAALNRLTERNIHVILATGKQFLALGDLVKQLRLRVPQITSCGAIIVQPQTSEILFRQEIPIHLALAVIEMGRRFNATVVVSRDNCTFAEKVNEDIEYLAEYGDPLPTLVPDLTHALRALPTQMMLIAKAHSQTFEEISSSVKVLLGTELAIYNSLPNVLDFLHKNSSKGLALKMIMEWQGIGPHETAAIGDSENDLSMFREAGFSFAMGNAGLDVRSAADTVTSTCEDDGVAVAVDKLLSDLY